MARGYQRIQCDQGPEQVGSSIMKPRNPTPALQYWHNPWMLLKDALLFSLAIPGAVSLFRPSIVCADLTTLRSQEGLAPADVIPPTICNCGRSVSEALSKGCKYDSLATAWLPEHCRDEELTAEFERMGPGGSWTYYTDKNFTQEIALDALAATADERIAFYATGQWHLAHCLFYWKKQYRSRFNNITVEPRYDSERHIVHCMTVLMDPQAFHRKSISSVRLSSDVL